MQRSSTRTNRAGTSAGPAADLEIRGVTPDDAVAIADIRVRGWQAAYRGQLDDALLDEMSADRDTERWRAHLSAPPPGWHGFIAQRHGTPVGFVTCGLSRDPGAGPGVGEVYAIYVRPEDIGTGVGRALLGRGMRALTEDGLQDLTLWVLVTNHPAQRFYRMAGFEPDGATKHDELDRFTVDEIRFHRRLP
jgi:ribosomal protein S18 acetylase RimI-like enzyme